MTNNKEVVKENINSDAAQWGITIHRSDIEFSGSNKEVNTRSPFPPAIKHHIDVVIGDIVSIAVDEFKIRSLGKLNKTIDMIYRKWADEDRLPVYNCVNTHTCPDGLYIVVSYGVGYGVDFMWTEFNDHIDGVKKRYKTGGKEEIRSIINSLVLPALGD